MKHEYIIYYAGILIPTYQYNNIMKDKHITCPIIVPNIAPVQTPLGIVVKCLPKNAPDIVRKNVSPMKAGVKNERKVLTKKN